MPTPDPIALPELPPPYQGRVVATSRNTPSVRKGVEMGGYIKSPELFTADQMRAYGQACVEALTPAPQPDEIARGGCTCPSHAGSSEWPHCAVHIVRDVCELDPADPGASDSVTVRVQDLERIIERHTTPPPLNELLGQREEFNLNEVSGNPGQLASLEQRARATELLRLHAEPIPVAVEDGAWFMVREQDALDAITAALNEASRAPQ